MIAVPLTRNSNTTSRTLQELLRAVGIPPSALSQLGVAQADTLSEVVRTLCNFGQPIPNAAQSLAHLSSRWDIAQSSVRPSPLPGLILFPLSSVDSQGFTCRRSVILTSGGSLEQKWWVLVVDTTVAAQIFRSRLNTMGVIGRFLIQNGIPFETAVMVPTNLAPVPRPVARQGLGMLTADQPYDRGDWSEYEGRLIAFLGSRRGALALKHGGVIWRLAIGRVSSKQVKAALEAPTGVARKHGCISGVVQDFNALVDRLEPHEIDIILGAYRYRQRTRRGDQWSAERVVTLWPTEAVWASSPYNTGEWNRVSEEWFQAHMNRLLRGTFQPVGSSTWREELSGQSITREVWSSYDSMVNNAFFG